MRNLTGVAIATAGLLLGGTTTAVAGDAVCVAHNEWTRTDTRAVYDATREGDRTGSMSRRVHITVERCLGSGFARLRTAEIGEWSEPNFGY